MTDVPTLREHNGGSRRLDRVLAPGFLEGIQQADLDVVRAMRKDAEQEETDLSFLRRLLQGRIDIRRAELDRRAAGVGGSDEALVESLATILADDHAPAAPRGLGRHIAVEPSRADSHRRYVEALVADVDLSDPAGHDDESLTRAVVTLEREEREISAKRRAVQQVMDACTAEIGRRYREGSADVADLLPTDPAG
jgi:hypothetical protein